MKNIALMAMGLLLTVSVGYAAEQEKKEQQFAGEHWATWANGLSYEDFLKVVKSHRRNRVFLLQEAHILHEYCQKNNHVDNHCKRIEAVYEILISWAKEDNYFLYEEIIACEKKNKREMEKIQRMIDEAEKQNKQQSN